MRKVAHALLGLSLLGLLSGCAYFYQPGPGLDRQLNEWNRQQEYGQALDVLTRLSAEHPGDKRLKTQLVSLQRQANIYETTTLNAARKLEHEGNWRAAALAYRDALDKLPRSQRLLTAQAAFMQRRKAYIDTLETEIALKRARYLVSVLPLRERRNQVGSNDSDATQNLDETRHEAVALSHKLTSIGNTALAEKDYSRAGEAFSLAEQLYPSPAARAGRAKVTAHEKAVAEQRARRRAAEARAKRAALERRYTEKFERCYKAHDWLCAREALAAMGRDTPDAAGLPGLRHKLTTQIRTTVKQEMEKGRRLYSQGRIREALDTWLAAQKLAPDNPDLKAHITRARKVLAKLQELSTRPLPPAGTPGGASDTNTSPASP